MTDAIICNECNAAVRSDVGSYYGVNRNARWSTYTVDDGPWHFCSATCLTRFFTKRLEAENRRAGIVGTEATRG